MAKCDRICEKGPYPAFCQNLVSSANAQSTFAGSSAKIWKRSVLPLIEIAKLESKCVDSLLYVRPCYGSEHMFILRSDQLCFRSEID